MQATKFYSHASKSIYIVFSRQSRQVYLEIRIKLVNSRVKSEKHVKISFNFEEACGFSKFAKFEQQ